MNKSTIELSKSLPLFHVPRGQPPLSVKSNFQEKF